jgi:hypothetical protein
MTQPDKGKISYASIAGIDAETPTPLPVHSSLSTFANGHCTGSNGFPRPRHRPMARSDYELDWHR